MQTNSVFQKTKEESVMNCYNEESADKAYDIPKNKLSGTDEIVKEQLIKPKMMIVGRDNFENVDILKNYQRIEMKEISKKISIRTVKI